MRAAAKSRAGWGRVAWMALFALISLAVSVAAYDFVYGLITRNRVIGTVALVLVGVVLLGLLGFILREAAGLARLGKVDDVRRKAEGALESGARADATAALDDLRALYARRRDLDWGMEELKSREGDLFEPDAMIGLAERSLMAGLDKQAEASIGRAARSVAAITAIVPLALVDVATALYVNLRMIREIAEIYGGRAGWLGSWRLLKAVAGHLVATGAVAIGDDMLGAALGGGAVARISRRFGEGLINGALTCRVGAAAIEVCRPLPFHVLPQPTGRGLTGSALKGFVSRAKSE
jgi:putative membrane protein